MDCIETVKLKNVEVQANGIIRNSKGYLIGRLVDSIDFEGEHIKGLKEEEFYDNMPLKEQAGILAKFLLEEFPDEVGKEGSEGAIECAIRLLKKLKA